jgi:hypothetical protein
MDLGYTDMTVVLFGYFDFRQDKIIIEDELIMQGSEKDFSIAKLTSEIKRKEEVLWTNVLTNEIKKPLIRVSDINHIVTNEILKNSNYQINFQPAKKDDNAAAINNLRALVGGKKVIIHPRCTTLIRHLKNAKWKSLTNKNEFARSPDDGHYDAVDALKYFLRAVAYNKNPYPANYDLQNLGNDIYRVQKHNYTKNVDNAEVYKKIFGRKR